MIDLLPLTLPLQLFKLCRIGWSCRAKSPSAPVASGLLRPKGAKANQLSSAIARRCTPPYGLHLRSSYRPATKKPAFARSCTPAHPCKRCTPALKGFICAALLRCSYHGNSLQPQPVALMARQQAAFAASCFRCSKPAFAASCTSSAHSAALRLEGLRLRSIALAISITATACIRSRLLSWQGSSLHSQPAASPLITAKRCTPALKGFVTAAVLRFSLPGNSLHPQPVACMAAACIRSQLHPLSMTALHSALKGSVCAALPSRSLSRQQSASAAGCLQSNSPHPLPVALAAASLPSQ